MGFDMSMYLVDTHNKKIAEHDCCGLSFQDYLHDALMELPKEKIFWYPMSLDEFSLFHSLRTQMIDPQDISREFRVEKDRFPDNDNSSGVDVLSISTDEWPILYGIALEEFNKTPYFASSNNGLGDVEELIKKKGYDRIIFSFSY